MNDRSCISLKKWTCIPFSPLPKIANCGDVCACQLIPLRHKPREVDDDDDLLDKFFCYILFQGLIEYCGVALKLDFEKKWGDDIVLPKFWSYTSPLPENVELKTIPQCVLK